MAGYLGHLVMRTLQSSPGVRPVVGSGFEPSGDGAVAALDDAPTAESLVPTAARRAAPQARSGAEPAARGEESYEDDPSSRVDALLELRPGHAPDERAKPGREPRGEPPASESFVGAARAMAAPVRAPIQPQAVRLSPDAEPAQASAEDAQPPGRRYTPLAVREPSAEAATRENTEAAPVRIPRPGPPRTDLPPPRSAARRSSARPDPTGSVTPPAAAYFAPDTVASMKLVPAPRLSPPAAPARAESAPGTPAPDVHITIGSVEIRAQVPAARPPQARPSRAQRPSLTLNDYLRRREGRS